jgi:hypothetical protein
MKISKLDSTVGGWFVGNFPNAAFQTEACEVSYKFHKRGEFWDIHYQEKITEVNLLVHGEMLMQGQLLTAGTIFILYPYEIADPVFVTDCEVVCVKLPGIIGDKVVVEKVKKS